MKKRGRGMRWASLFLIIILVLLIIGCATTEVASIKNPLYENIKYDKVLILTYFDDIDYRQEAENCFVIILKESGIKAVRSIDLFPPYKNYTNDEFDQIILDHKIEGIFSIVLKDTSTTTDYYGGTTSYFQYEVNLFDTRTDEIAWMATSTTTLYGSMGYTAIQSLAGEILKKFAQDYDLPYKNPCTSKPSS
jgi:hypothetical protein